jgi:hypothetical protein
MVSPAFVQNHSQLASVDDVFNAILVRGDAIGDVVFYGKGAGKMPTASAVVADVIDCARHMERKKFFGWADSEDGYVADHGESSSSFYLRATTENAAAALAQINSVFGTVKMLTRENAPEDSADYCSDCKYTDCVYKSQTIYERERPMRGYYTTDISDEGDWREKLVHSPYDRCVYKCDNDVVDHQVCIFEFEDGVTACHTMNAFSKEVYRDIKIHGTKAELVGNMEALYLELRPFGGEVIRYDFSDADTSGTHGGGDLSMMHSLYLERNGQPAPGITYIDVSIDSHRMSFGAEKSRISGGMPIKI